MRRGLGSAIVFLQNTGDKQRYRDAVLACCLRDIGYDVQAEGTKGLYLYFAIGALGDEDYFIGPVIDRLLSGRCSDRLEQQLVDLLAAFAKDGNPIAAGALRTRYGQFAGKRRLSRRDCRDCRWEYVALVLLDIDGFAGFRRSVTDMGLYIQRVPSGRDDVDLDCLIPAAKQRFGGQRVSEFLDPTSDVRRTAREQDAVSALAGAMAADEAARQAHRQSQVQPTTADGVHHWARESVANGRRYGSVSHAFRKASDAEKVKLAHAVLSEPDDAVRGWMLRAFWRQPFPLGPGPLLPYLESDDERLRDAAIGVLGVSQDAAVHAAAVRLLQVKGLDSGGLALLEANYRRSDDTVIADAAHRYRRSLPHHIVMDLRDIYGNHRSARALPVLLRAYREGDCGYCRWWVVQAMQHCGVLPDDIVDECQFDSYDGTRRLASRLIARRP